MITHKRITQRKPLIEPGAAFDPPEHQRPGGISQKSPQIPGCSPGPQWALPKFRKTVISSLIFMDWVMGEGINAPGCPGCGAQKGTAQGVSPPAKLSLPSKPNI